MVKAFGSFVLLLTAGCGALAAGFGDWNPPADDEYFPEHQFRRNVETAMRSVEEILDNAKSHVQLAEDVDHTWDDKYALAEWLTNTLVAAQLDTLARLGLSDQVLERALVWAHGDSSDNTNNGTVNLNFQAKQSSEFVREVEIEEKVLDETVQNTAAGISLFSSGTKVTRKVKRYIFDVQASYHIEACQGSCQESSSPRLELRSRKMSATVTQSSDRKPAMDYGSSSQVPLKWLLKMISQTAGSQGRMDTQFAIDRTVKTCKTPRRNDDIKKALRMNRQLRDWADFVQNFFLNVLYRDSKVGEVTSLESMLFYPVMPWLGNQTAVDASTAEVLLQQHRSVLYDSLDRLSERFPPPKDDSIATIISSVEASIWMVCKHLENLIGHYFNSLNYIEDMLKKQLVRAIGKEISPQDFDSFLRSYNQKFFGLDYAPKSFSHAIRRPNQYPVGILSIEDDIAGPVETLVRSVSDGPLIRIPINAATFVEMSGERYLHGYMRTEFKSSTSPQPQLVARARQFSSFIVLIGTMAGPDRFDPKQAIILQNKDEILIPLLTEVLPSAVAFRDAIASLSPEQQAFAKAFRGMQLESSVFGVCVIQLKPQLEKLLNLPDGALTKEIMLTEELTSLFVDYQIPSDLLSFDGSPESTVGEKVSNVRTSVKAVMDVIDSTKAEQLEEERKRAEMRKPQRVEMRNPPGVDMMYTAGSARASSSSLSSASQSSVPSATPSAAPSTGPSRSPSSAPSMGERSLREEASSESSSSNADASGSETSEASYEAPHEQSRPSSLSATTTTVDFTRIPKQLDAKLEEFDTDGYLRSTIIKTSPSNWHRHRQENLLSPLKTTDLSSSEMKAEAKKAFDLLDAMSRSGALSIDAAELHVIVGVTHCFETSLIDTLIKDSINPIEKLEQSFLLLGSIIYGEPAGNLLADGATRQRLASQFPALVDAKVDESVMQEDKSDPSEVSGSTA